jgi:hypothetical protein
MPTLARVRTYVDDRLADLWQNQIIPRQDAYFASHGKYWQGLRTAVLSALPDNTDDGSTTVREATPTTNTHPTDQAETWTDVGIDLGTSIPMALQIDSYGGPFGDGYVGTVWALYDGEVYTRSQNRGPETYRTEPWRRMTAAEVTELLAELVGGTDR